MLIGVIADDFTGASDIANTLTKGGMRTLLVLGAPEGTPPDTAEVVVVALKSRSIPAADAVAQSVAALSWLRQHGCQQVVFKYCSTFDSTPQGNIGPVAEALAEQLGASGVVVCPAFPAAGRTVYQGHLFVHDRLLSESGLENHPLNPMSDPDIRRWLRRQTRGDVGHVRHETVRQGAETIAAALATSGQRLAVVDAISDADLAVIGKAAAGAALVTGGSGVALGLPNNFRAAGWSPQPALPLPPTDGRALVLAGSCSTATRGQIAHYAEHAPALKIDVDAVMSGDNVLANVLEFLDRNEDGAPLVYSSADPVEVAAAQQRHGREALAERLDGLFAEIAHASVESGVRRLVVAGGETSAAAMTGLRARQLWIGPEIATGVPLLLHEGDWTGRLALKSGNFGGPAFFSEALAIIGGAR